MRMTVSMISCGSDTSRHTGNASTPANSLNRRALPSMTGMAAVGPMSPRPRTADPSVTTATVFFLMVKSWARAGSSVDGHADPGHAWRVGHRQVVAVVDLGEGNHLDLAALVHVEGPVEPAQDLHAFLPLHVGHHPRCVVLVPTVDDDVIDQVVPAHVETAHGNKCWRRLRRSPSANRPRVLGTLSSATSMWME